jgi:glycerol-3-phosphate O-acyltransferase
VPCTISYQLVLEAETLIEDHLKETGKSRYIIEDDAFSQPRLVLNFLNKLLSLDSRIVVTFSAPLDIFGNRVDRQGRSLDSHGRVVDPRRYLIHGDALVEDDQRDAQYTRELGDEIVRAFRRDNVVMSTHVVAGSLLNLLRRDNPELDLYRLLRAGGKVSSYSLIELHAEVERVTSALGAGAEGPRPGWAAGDDASVLVDDALKHFAIFHARPAALRHGDRVFHEDRNLLLYYGNRLRGYDLGRALATRAAGAPPS